ncbi:MAG TPA: hypothetical protein VKN14_05455 [Flavobacteriaceae bacterium]|nr:hypothetical protein [Flavobacteriaceae bacterium]
MAIAQLKRLSESLRAINLRINDKQIQLDIDAEIDIIGDIIDEIQGDEK